MLCDTLYIGNVCLGQAAQIIGWNLICGLGYIKSDYISSLEFILSRITVGSILLPTT